MIVSDRNAKFIVLTPSEQDLGLVYDYINVAGLYNGNASVSKTVAISQVPLWSMFSTIPISYLATINQIYIKNLLTGVEYGLLDVPFTPYTSASVTTLKGIITTKLLVLGLTGVTQTTVIDEDAGNFTYSLSGLPYHISADRIEYVSTASAFVNYFSTGDTASVLFNGEEIIITPSFFGLETFSEGVYNFTFTGHQTSGGSVLRTGCYFLDITLKCRLALPAVADCITEKVTFNYMMLHYALIAGSNCNCDDCCSDLYTIYSYLNTHLPIDLTSGDCGC